MLALLLHNKIYLKLIESKKKLNLTKEQYVQGSWPQSLTI